MPACTNSVRRKFSFPKGQPLSNTSKSHQREMPDGGIVMHEVSLDRLNDVLGKAEQVFTEIEDRAQEYGRAAYEGARRVEEWARSVIEEDNDYSSLFVTEVDQINESRAREQELEKMAIQTASENEREEDLYKTEAAELEGVVRELQEQKNKFPEDEERLTDSFLEKKERHDDRERQIREVAARLDGTISEVKAELNMYQDALGLRLGVLADRHIQFVFAYIDPSDHDRQFSVEIKVIGTDNNLLALKCVPMLERFPELKEKLGNDGKIVSFLREMRKEFQTFAIAGNAS